MHPREQTIFALSTGRPPSGIAVVRVSGPRAKDALRAIAGRAPAPRQASKAVLRDAVGQPIDDGLVLWFPGPGSATGEDVAEFHIHGGRAVLAALFTALLEIRDLRPAEPGEFTRRAFENGQLDLTEAEGLDDLIHADTEHQRRLALRQLRGLLGDRVRDWRERIIGASALIEAGIDFSDEGDVPAELIVAAFADIEQLRDEIVEVLSKEGKGERLRDGLLVAIAGPPNVGKSTLINQLARREVAIVSPHAGTTRDVIEVHLDLEGFPVTVIDTAGIRDSEDPVEQEGVRRAKSRAAEADLVLWMTENEEPGEEWRGDHAELWRVRNKIDVTPHQPAEKSKAGGKLFLISAQQGEGVADLVDALVRFAVEFFATREDGLITRTRHREGLSEAAQALDRSLSLSGEGEELIAEELRAASHALGRLLGRVDVEEVLGAIFEKFCIGK